jgi:hypothetical protein
MQRADTWASRRTPRGLALAGDAPSTEDDGLRKAEIVNDYQSSSEVQLSGDELERARQLLAQAQASMSDAREYLTQLGTLVGGALDDTTAAVAVQFPPSDAASDEGHVVACYYASDGRCLWCLEDPPGVCRPCGDSKPGPKSPAPLIVLSR